MHFRFLRCLTVSLLTLLGSYTLNAQGFSLKIQFTDASNDEKVAGVAVAISKAGSEAVEKFAQTDDEGRATLTGVSAGKYVIKGILLGYETFEEAIEVKKNTDLGVRKLIPEVNQLAGAV
ncbi:MAG: carboxypeptidase regulatory-like domain-containing protein, partial [Bacteroidales bacterium]|nr:carboxypeptidase regulatory-like domain-containing protein [Bacteroidales bacterium]